MHGEVQLLDASQQVSARRQRSASPSASSAAGLVLALLVRSPEGTLAQLRRSLPVMTDPADALQDPVTRRAERGQLQRDWIAASAESGRQAREALAKAAELLAENIPGRRPDEDVARAWAEIAQGWASLSRAEAVRSIAAAAFAVDQAGVNTFPAKSASL
jgi:hypothetical protein